MPKQSSQTILTTAPKNGMSLQDTQTASAIVLSLSEHKQRREEIVNLSRACIHLKTATQLVQRGFPDLAREIRCIVECVSERLRIEELALWKIEKR